MSIALRNVGYADISIIQEHSLHMYPDGVFYRHLQHKALLAVYPSAGKLTSWSRKADRGEECKRTEELFRADWKNRVHLVHDGDVGDLLLT